MRALLGMDGVVFDLEGLGLVFRIVRDDELHGTQDAIVALGGVVQILAQAVLEQGVFDGVGGLGHADALAEIADGMAGIAAAAQTAERGHRGSSQPETYAFSTSWRSLRLLMTV